MTAYKNRKAALAVTAGLVGALTLGGAVVAPAAVYAQTGAEMQADWNAGAKVTKATNGKGQQVKDPSKAVFAKGKGKYLVPTEVTNRFGTSYDLTKAEDYVFQYKKLGGTETVEVKNGKFKKADEFFANADAGTYTVAVAKKGDTANFTVVARFTIDQLSLEGAKVEGAVTFSGETFNEAFQAGTIKVVDAKGNALSADLTSGDFDVNFIYNADGTAYAAGPDGLMAAGNYKVQISSKNDYTGKAVIDVAVSKLGLSKAVVTVDDDNYASGVNNSQVLSNVKVSGLKSVGAYVKLEALVDPAGNINPTDLNAKGVWSATVASNDSANVTGTAKVQFTNYDKAAGDLYYGSVPYAQAPSYSGLLPIDLTAGQTFDASKLAVKKTPSSAAYAAGIEVSYAVKSTGEKVDASALANPGEYTVTVRAVPSQDDNGQWLGGSYTLDVEVSGAELNSADDAAFFLGDQQLDSNSPAPVTYDGSDFLKSISAKVVDASGNAYEAGKDYELVATDEDGKAVDSIVSAGEYKVTVVPKTFKFDGGNPVLDFTVAPVTLGRLVPAVSDMKFDAWKNGFIPKDFGWYGDNEFYLTYTGKDLEVPGVRYQVVEGTGSDAKYTYVDLDKSLYSVLSVKNAKGETVKAMNAAGKYTVKIALTDEAEGNYILDSDTFEVTVAKQQSFADVAPEAWYAEPVAKAKDAGYVNGIAGTKLFAPEASITRADAVCILFNMAGGKLGSDEFQYSEDTGYVTGFSDVDGKAYYAKALAWAKASGVANGYGDGTFKPAAQISREEFAALLANYAKMSGRYEAPATDELSKLGDAGTVSAWAKDVVNWAVSEKVMGNGGFVAGQSDITRAEVAAMAVNFQPSKL